jgi:hypothetical protein
MMKEMFCSVWSRQGQIVVLHPRENHLFEHPVKGGNLSCVICSPHCDCQRIGGGSEKLAFLEEEEEIC